jgi:diguanylate cyclase (GGDEF)-like protein
MQKPAIPSDENTRIDALRALNILDSSPEERFDRITRLARRMFGVPIALVTLIDTDRQWFLSSFGLDVKETSRDISFCGHAILGDEIFTVPDAALDPRFNDNPLVTDAPNIRFYAGCPISVSNGSKLGTICLIDQSPREFDDEDKVLLRDLARLVEQEVAAVQLATLDELTTISNRRGFEVLSNHALSLCKRANGTATFLFIDLDKFKPINDTYGHAEGDYALQVFSHILRDVFRDSDVIGRIGGDEFAVLLTMTSATDTEEVIQRLKTAVSEHNIKASRGYNLEFSYGIAEFDSAKHDSISSLLAEADAKMYQQKKSRK